MVFIASNLRVWLCLRADPRKLKREIVQNPTSAKIATLENFPLYGKDRSRAKPIIQQVIIHTINLVHTSACEQHTVTLWLIQYYKVYIPGLHVPYNCVDAHNWYTHNTTERLDSFMHGPHHSRVLLGFQGRCN